MDSKTGEDLPKVFPSELPADPDRFTKITLLLQLVNILNQANPVYRTQFLGNTLRIPDDVLTEFNSLEGVSTILLMKREVIATSFYADPIQTSTTSRPNTDLDVSLEGDAHFDDAGPHTESAQSVEGNDTSSELATHEETNVAAPQLRRPLQIIAVANPTSATNTQGNTHKIRALDMEKAADHWPRVKANQWHCMFR